jgi:hypothetical protein
MRFRQAATRAQLILFIVAAALVGAAGPADAAANDQAGAVHSRSDVARWFAESSPVVLALPGAVFADNDEDNNRLVFGVERAAAITGVRTALAHLGVPSSAFSVRVTAPIYNVDTLRDKFRPTIAGIQIHFGQFLCSLGFNADDGTDRSLITASHCTNKQGGVEGTQYFQPLSTVDATVIATEVEDPRYFRGGECPRGRKCRFSDSARASYSANVASTRGSIAQTSAANNGSLEVTGSFTVTGQDDATTNFPSKTIVNKVGRTTGWTQGEVTATCVNTNVSGTNISQLCQTFVQNPQGAVVVQGGDSGSGVFRITAGSNVTLVGILWGGNGNGTLFVFSPLKQVEDELGDLVATHL